MRRRVKVDCVMLGNRRESRNLLAHLFGDGASADVLGSLGSGRIGSWGGFLRKLGNYNEKNEVRILILTFVVVINKTDVDAYLVQPWQP